MTLQHSVGAQVSFDVDHVIAYENQGGARGTSRCRTSHSLILAAAGSPAFFDASWYCASFVALRVTLRDPTVKLVSSTHVSVAAYALHARHVGPAPRAKKGKK